MKIVETREFFELFRGEKEFFPGRILSKKYLLEYVVLVPLRASPNDSNLLKINDIGNMAIHVNNNSGMYKIKTLFSILLLKNFPFLQFSPTLFYHILKENPDLIIDIPYTTFTPRTYIAYVASRILYIPILFINSGDLPGKKGFLRRLLMPLESYIYKRSKIIALNAIAKDYLSKEYSLKEGAISVIPKGVDTKKWSPLNKDLHEMRSKYNLPSQNIILYVGRLDRRKGIASLIEAAKQLNNFTIMLVGNGPDKDYFVDMCRDFDINNLIFLEFVENVKLPELYAIADIVIIPDMTNPVGFSTVLSEAMSMGKAIVIGIKDFEGAVPIEHMKTGIIIEPNSTKEIVIFVNYLHENPQVKRFIESNVREFAKSNMDYDIVMDRYYNIIMATIKN